MSPIVAVGAGVLSAAALVLFAVPGAPNSSHRIAAAAHVGLLDDEQTSAISVRAIDDVVRAARSGTPLAP